MATLAVYSLKVRLLIKCNYSKDGGCTSGGREGGRVRNAGRMVDTGVERQNAVVL